MKPSSLTTSPQRTNSKNQPRRMSQSSSPLINPIDSSPSISPAPPSPNTPTISASPGAAKKNIACSPGSPRDFFLMFFLGCSRKILGVKSEHKLALYLLVVFLGSLFGELFTMPKNSVLQRLSHPLNTFVIKFGFGWILVVTSPLIIISSRVYSRNGNVTTVANFGRLFVNTFVWFICTSTFFWWFSSRGICHDLSQSNATHTTIKNAQFQDCKRSGFQWSGFDISGHTFLLVLCNLILIEECRVMKLVDKVFQNNSNEGINENNSNNTPSNDNNVLSWVPNSRLALQILLCLCGMTSVAYDYVLVITVLFYHTILEKMLAYLVAAAAWYGTYRVLFPRLAIQPGAGASSHLTTGSNNNNNNGQHRL